MRSILPALALLGLAACGADSSAPEGGGSTGAAAAASPLRTRFAGPTGLSCASCHVLEGEFRPPAIAGPLVAHRKGYWGEVLAGDADTLEGAVAYCLQRFVRKARIPKDAEQPAPADLPPLDAAGESLVREIVATIAKGPAPSTPVSARTIELAAEADLPAVAALEADAARGEAVYRAACAVCHGAKGEGGYGPELAGMESPPPLTIAYVRLGHEHMPAFSKQALLDGQVADVARFVKEMK